MKLTSSIGSDLHGVANLLQSADQANGGLVRVGAVEMGGAEFAPFGAGAQHAPGGGEHGSGHGDDGLLGAASCAQAVELGLQVAALDLHGRPGGLHHGGREPLAATAQPGAASLARALLEPTALKPGIVLSSLAACRNVPELVLDCGNANGHAHRCG